MDRISSENLIRYTKNLKTYVDNSLSNYYDSNTTVITFNITEANTNINIKNLTGLTSIDWGDGTSTALLSASHTYKQTGTFTCRLSGVTDIGTYAFEGCESLTCAVIGDSVTTLGDGAFRNCKNFTDVVISKNTAIGAGPFWNCSNLKTVVISDGVPSIGDSAFQECSSLKEVVIPYSVTSIGQKAFYGCTSLTRVEIKGSIATIAPQMFRNCTSLQNILLPNSLTKFEDRAFTGCSKLKSIVISKNISTIAANVFHSCSSLTIYCECAEADKPSGWDSNWDQLNNNGKRVPTVWGYSLDQVKQELTEVKAEISNNGLTDTYYAIDNLSFSKTVSYATGSCSISNDLYDDEDGDPDTDFYPSVLVDENGSASFSGKISITSGGVVSVTLNAVGSNSTTRKRLFKGSGYLSSNGKSVTCNSKVTLSKPQLVKLKDKKATLNTSLYSVARDNYSCTVYVYASNDKEVGNYGDYSVWVTSVHVAFPLELERSLNNLTLSSGSNTITFNPDIMQVVTSSGITTFNYDTITGTYQKVLF